MGRPHFALAHCGYAPQRFTALLHPVLQASFDGPSAPGAPNRQAAFGGVDPAKLAASSLRGTVAGPGGLLGAPGRRLCGARSDVHPASREIKR
jgi:hypothetical protein